MKNALITGINGFTGGYVASALRAAGYRVFGTGVGPTGVANFPYFQCDLCDRNKLSEIVDREQPDVVVHLAAIAFAAHGDIEALYRTNLLGSRTLLDVLAGSRRPPRSTILASSANVYGSSSVEILEESTPPSPNNDYAVTKLAMEHVAGLFRDRLPITIVRPFNYTGVGQSEQFLIPKIVGHFRRRLPVLQLGNLDVIRDFSDVRAVAQCYVALLERSPDRFIDGEAFNICSGTGNSISAVLEILGQLTGHSPKVQVNPDFVRLNEVKRLVGSNAKLHEAIGPVRRISIHETLAWMLSSPTDSSAKMELSSGGIND